MKSGAKIDLKTIENQKNKAVGSKLVWNNGKEERGITLIALVVTILFSYYEKIKCSNNNGFLLQTI